MMRSCLVLMIATAVGAAEIRPAVELAAELVESRIVHDHPDARWLRAVAGGLRAGRISVHEATSLLAMIGHGGGGPVAVVGAPTVGAVSAGLPDSPAPAPAGPADTDKPAAVAVVLAGTGAPDLAAADEQALAALSAEIEQLDALNAAEVPAAAAAPAEAQATELAEPSAGSTPEALDAADGIEAALTALDNPAPQPAEPAAEPVAALPAEPAVAAPVATPVAAKVQPELTPPAEPTVAGPLLATVVHVKPAANPDDPDLVMIEGTRIRKGQTLSLRRSGQEAVRLLVLRVEGTLAMAMVLGSTWAEQAERPVAMGDQAYALSGD